LFTLGRNLFSGLACGDNFHSSKIGSESADVALAAAFDIGRELIMSRVTASIAFALVLFGGQAWAQPLPNAASSGSEPAPVGTLQGGAPSESGLNYQLGAEDKVRVITYDEPQLTGEFYVNSSGNISLPLIGEVPARGRTVGELQADIENLLKQGYIKNPSVSVEVLTFRPFYILGEVNKPGEYPYTDQLTVMSAVATAGGFTYRANESYIFIKHENESTETKTKVTASTEVHPGDTIRVVERYF
jgi:protein involved in polysaccharide export with SLBB domain